MFAVLWWSYRRFLDIHWYKNDICINFYINVYIVLISMYIEKSPIRYKNDICINFSIQNFSKSKLRNIRPSTLKTSLILFIEILKWSPTTLTQLLINFIVRLHILNIGVGLFRSIPYWRISCSFILDYTKDTICLFVHG